eukprot:2309-Heterococcus_DN1.PRE.1
MCWSQGTSAVVVAFEITCLFIIAFKCKGPRFSALPLQLSVLSMELIEFFLWPHVTDDVTNADQGSKTPSCTHWNKILTTVVFFNLTLQPLLLNYGAYLLHRTRSKQGLVLSAAVFLSFSGALLLGEVYNFNLRSLNSSQYLGSEGLETCSYKGRFGHMHWVFKTSTHFLCANWFAWLLLWLCPFIESPASGPHRQEYILHFLVPLAFGLMLMLLHLWRTSGSFET